MKKLRPVKIRGDLAFVPLTKDYVAVIDAADAHLIGKKWNWTARESGNTVYAYRMCFKGVFPQNIQLHRLIMKAPDGMVVDHIDGNGLNNRRSNLRLVTPAENARNTVKTRAAGLDLIAKAC